MENTEIAVIKKEVVPFTQRVVDVTILAQELEITDKDSQKNGEKLLKTMQGIAKDIEDKEKEITAKPKEFIEMVNDIVKDVTKELGAAKGILSHKLLARDEETDDVKGVTNLWKIEIEDESQVPIEFMSPDPTKIRAAIKAGAEVPGVKKIDYKIVK